jgi:hypothetical protein
MSVYKFPCCGKELSTESFASSVTVAHNCNGEIPCIGVAFIMGGSGEEPESDVASLELDAALDQVPVAEPVAGVPAAEV